MHDQDSRTRCQEILWGPAVTPDTYSSSEEHQLRSDPSGNVLIVGHSPPRPPRLNYTSRLSRQPKVPAFLVLLPRSQATATSQYRYQLMHLGFSTRLSATETQSLPSSFGPRGTTFRLGYSYTPLSLTAVTTYAFSTKTLNRTLMAAWT